jgi:uncharacterized protein
MDVMLIVDAHCHIGDSRIPGVPPGTEKRICAYLYRAERAGIGKTIAFPIFRSEYLRGNKYVAALVARHPERFIGFVAVHSEHDAGRIREIVNHAVSDWGFRGIKVHGAEATPTSEVCEAAMMAGVPVIMDVFNKPAILDNFAEAYPDVNFIIPHLGSFADHISIQRHVISRLVRFPNLYADLSGVRSYDVVVEAVKRAGPEKIIFGSDAPDLHPGLELAKIQLLGLSKLQEAMVLGANIMKLLSVSHRKP